jgi:hypothetical protein
MVAKRPLRFLINFVGVGNLGNAAHRCLRGQSKHRARVGVSDLMQIELPDFSGFKRACRQKIASLIATFEGVSKLLGLIWRRQDFDVRNEFHVFKYGTSRAMCQFCKKLEV